MDAFVGAGFVNISLNLFICSKLLLQSETLLHISLGAMNFAQQRISGTKLF
jgi:hypothetical protein